MASWHTSSTLSLSYGSPLDLHVCDGDGGGGSDAATRARRALVVRRPEHLGHFKQPTLPLPSTSLQSYHHILQTIKDITCFHFFTRPPRTIMVISLSKYLIQGESCGKARATRSKKKSSLAEYTKILARFGVTYQKHSRISWSCCTALS